MRNIIKKAVGFARPCGDVSRIVSTFFNFTGKHLPISDLS